MTNPTHPHTPETSIMADKKTAVLASAVPHESADNAYTIWTWMGGNPRGVTLKTYHLTDSNSVSAVKIIFLPISNDNSNSQNKEPEISSVSFGEMLESIDKRQSIVKNGNTYRALKKVFRREIDGDWTCELRVWDGSNELTLLSVKINEDFFVHTAKIGDILTSTNQPIDKKTFTQTNGDFYSITISSAGESYTTREDVSFAHVFTLAAYGDTIKTGNTSRVVHHKICDEIPLIVDTFKISFVFQ